MGATQIPPGRAGHCWPACEAGALLLEPLHQSTTGKLKKKFWGLTKRNQYHQWHFKKQKHCPLPSLHFRKGHSTIQLERRTWPQNKENPVGWINLTLSCPYTSHLRRALSAQCHTVGNSDPTARLGKQGQARIFTSQARSSRTATASNAVPLWRQQSQKQQFPCAETAPLQSACMHMSHDLTKSHGRGTVGSSSCLKWSLHGSQGPARPHWRVAAEHRLEHTLRQFS
jgi:hypothetical protein